ncbi:glycosyltransferase [Peribacillus frigoritolerans]
MSEPQKRVFIFNGYGMYGGAYMLYQIGRVCFEEFNTPVFIVQNYKGKDGAKRFFYPYDFPTISPKQMEDIITEDDLFVCNPVHSYYSFGSRLPAKKLMYLQGANTYSNLDTNFNYYVSVSQFVQQHVKTNFGVDSPVINPFIKLATFNKGIQWDKRHKQILVLAYKKETLPLYNELVKRYQRKYPFCTLTFKKIRNMSQKQLATIMGKHKYYLTLSPVEGFGLPPLEAMSSGCAVLGFDGYGGREYFSSSNSYVVKCRDFDPLVDFLHKIYENPDIGKNFSENSIMTAKRFSFEKFKHNWSHYLKDRVFVD